MRLNGFQDRSTERDNTMKIIASDYDGTLHHHYSVSPQDREAIRKWRDHGNLFGIVTGRATDMLDTAKDEKLELDFVIVFNGVDVYDVQKDITQPTLIKRLAGSTSSMYDMLQIILQAEGNWAEVVTPTRSYFFTHNDTAREHKHWTAIENAKPIKEYIQIYARYENESISLKIAKELEEKYPSEVSALVNGFWLNAAPPAITKASGVWEYAKYMGVKKEDIFTIGDSYNDLDMLEVFNGYAMANGAEAVKKAAKGVCVSVAQLVDIAL